MNATVAVIRKLADALDCPLMPLIGPADGETA